MEERIIDDEYGRGVRLKKTKNGYVDVTDELAENAEEGVTDEAEDSEEIAFEFPEIDEDEDDEDLVGLSLEEAAALRKKKEEEKQKRRAEYEQVCKEGDELLATGSFKAAELKFEKALLMDDEATDASVGYWRAKTADFAEPEALIDEYAEAGVETLEYDLGYKATETIRKRFRNVFQRKYAELEEEEAPLAAAVEKKRTARRGILKTRVKRATITFVAFTVLAAALLVLTLAFASQIYSTKENVHLVPTIVCGAAFFIAFIAFILATNKFVNALRMFRKNERLSSTEEGKKLLELRARKELYGALLETAETEAE